MRFANWLNNGQPAGVQDNTTTERGAYTITQEGIDANSITRNQGAAIFLPSNNEWYKAAYYDPFSQRYKLTPFSDGYQFAACEVPPGTTTYSANCDNAVGDLTAAGSYNDSASPYGTYDQGGNVAEWNETVYLTSARAMRGGAFSADGFFLGAQYGQGWTLPQPERDGTGFRVAMTELRDITPPTITSIAVNHDSLWPPNDKFVPVDVMVGATDDSGQVTCKIDSVTSNESDAEQFQITGDLTANLLAARSGDGSGRVYTIVVQCTDPSKNAANGSVDVKVPQNRR